jgi:putative ABC transport system permease protein
MKNPFPLSVGVRNLRFGLARTAFSIGGVAVATLLLAFVIALYRGWNDELVAYIHETDVDLWVMGEGADSFFTPSLLLSGSLVEIGNVDGVAGVRPLIGRAMKLRAGDEGWDSYVIGFDPGAAGGPVRVKKGSGEPGDGEIVIDDVLARLSGLDVGDEVQAGLRKLKVVGISGGGNLVLAQLSFVNTNEAHILVGVQGTVNFALVDVEPGHDPADVAAAIKSEVDSVEVLEASAFASNSQDVLQRSVIPILVVIILMAIIVGTVVVGLTVYTSVIEKEREFGILKAVGVPGHELMRIVLEQSLLTGLAGFISGAVLAWVAARLAGAAIPQVVTSFRLADLSAVLAATAVMTVVAAIIPIYRVLRVDTLSVFKA